MVRLFNIFNSSFCFMIRLDPTQNFISSIEEISFVRLLGFLPPSRTPVVKENSFMNRPSSPTIRYFHRQYLTNLCSVGGRASPNNPNTIQIKHALFRGVTIVRASRNGDHEQINIYFNTFIFDSLS